MKRTIFAIVALLLVASGASAHNPKAWRKMKQSINILWTSDLDKGGCYDQKVIANLLGEMAGVVKPECILTTGDTHHGNGVKSVDDDDWKENFEDIYNHPKLKRLDWMPVFGNHEYRGSTQAVLDYSKVNPRWTIADRYYTRVFKKGNLSIRFVIIDTTPMIEKYRSNNKLYKDASKQDKEAQLQWLDDLLSKAEEDWVIVAGHHPIHADTKKNKEERTNMRESVNKILRRHDNVAMYLCGHIHNFQHLRDKDRDIDYIVNSSASLGRGVSTTKRTVYCSPESGFSVITASKRRLSVNMIDKNGNLLHTVNKCK